MHIAVIQESKIHSMLDKIIMEIWGGRHVNWVSIDSVGSADGIILLWDSRYDVVLDCWKEEFSSSAILEVQENK